MAQSPYKTDQTALLMVDPYNDFMTEGGKFFGAIAESAAETGMFGNLRKILHVVREKRIQVFIVPHHRSTPGDFDNWQHINMFQKANLPSKAFEKGTWGGEFNEEFGPQKGDVVVAEHWAQSGFANTDLDAQLKQHGIRRIILVGLIANSCIESTARYGMEMGYHVTLVKDATAAFSKAGMEAAATNAPMFAHAIFTTNELVGELSEI
jgi:nicotinamidase-related amidase